MNNKTIKETFWDILPLKMKEAGVRQVDLANALELNKATVSCWMKRKSFPEMDNIPESFLDCLVIHADPSGDNTIRK